MRKLALATIAAFASLTISAHVVANVANARDAVCGGCHTNAMPAPQEMASKAPKATPAVEPTGWFIRAIQKVDGETAETRFTQHDDKGGVFVAIFESKAACEKARTTDPQIVGTLASYTAAIKLRKGTVVISCQPWTHPVIPDEPVTPPAPKGVDI